MMNTMNIYNITIKRSGCKKLYRDHLGNVYFTIKEMCDAYGINRTTYADRIEKGLSIEEALTTPVIKHNTKKYCVTDPWGKEHASENAMCEYFGMHPNTVRGRLERGWSIEDALLIPVGSIIGVAIEGEYIKNNA